jgi:hypothetical protein
MSTTTSPPRALSAEQLGEMLQLTRVSDSVELKVTIPEADHRSAVVALGMDPLDAQIRQIFFFDTPDLTLDQHGVVVRARRVQGKGEDSVVKLRPVNPSELPSRLRKSPNFRVEVDALPGGFVCSGTMKAAIDGTRVLRVVRGELPVRKLFNKEQREYFAEHVPPGVSLNDLSVLVLKLRRVPEELGRRIVAELWVYPDGSRVLELSTRCTIDEPFQVAAETRAYLDGLGIDLAGEQQTKTRRALEYFAQVAREAA